MAGNERLTRGFLRLSAWLGLVGPESRVNVDGTITPTIPFDMFAAESVTINGIVEVGANGEFEVLRCPEDEIWNVQWAQESVESSATFTINKLMFSAVNGALVLWDGQNVSGDPVVIGGGYMPNLWFYPGDGLVVDVTGFSVTGEAQVDMRVRRWRMDRA